jgi:phospholipase/lecithinase/hemolysin
MKPFALVCAGCFAAIVAVGSAAQRADAAKAYSHVVVFGDSLSDQGNAEASFGYPPAPLYYKGRFSNNENWIDLLGQQLHVKVESSAINGTNYAFAFATTGSQNAPPPVPFTPQNIDQQEKAYLANVSGKADPNALYIIEGGGTDILGLLFQVESDPLMLLFIPTMALNGTQNTANETQALLSAGAQHVVVSNVPDLSLLPIVVETSGLGGIIAPSVATNAAQLWDQDLANDVLPMTKDGRVTLWDFYSTANLALKAAKQLGIKNTTTECIEGYGATQNPVNNCSKKAVPKHAFYDQVHFTVGGYFGMEQGAFCALGYSTEFGWKQSQCVVSSGSDARIRTAPRLHR